ncbi:hypothetical protein [Pseudoclavibacter sp. RFBB5]|uniref:hypothetical protein n=1 Tax=Pseudoclavibacter sp. RFBB5 TaxID=2080574 RepID=UPI000CE926C3|nr:hypothetical protein [Pseudoclavibacter sp. RFBB5]PPG29624.1 hypothetical protein C5B97_11675 [Pseudoclavibacter sp. RFBB5]
MAFDLRRHFLRSLDSLQAATDFEADEFTVIASSKILREFLLEGTLNKVGRVLGNHPRFLIPQQREVQAHTHGVVLEYEPYELDRRVAKGTKDMRLASLDQFLAYRLLTLDGEMFTVKNVVRVAANGLGGVHVDKVTKPEDKRLLEKQWEQWVDARHLPMSQVSSALRQIGANTVEACTLMRFQATVRTSL